MEVSLSSLTLKIIDNLVSDIIGYEASEKNLCDLIIIENNDEIEVSLIYKETDRIIFSATFYEKEILEVLEEIEKMEDI